MTTQPEQAPFEKLAALDRMIHEPARLAILTALAACENADFLFLQRLTGLTKGNLSSHLGKLEEAGLVHIDKAFVGKSPRTTLSLSAGGRAAIGKHWEALEQLGKDIKSWQSADEGTLGPAME